MVAASDFHSASPLPGRVPWAGRTSVVATTSAPAARATAAVASVESESTTTSSSTSGTRRTQRSSRSATSAPTVASSFRAGQHDADPVPAPALGRAAGRRRPARRARRPTTCGAGTRRGRRVSSPHCRPGRRPGQEGIRCSRIRHGWHPDGPRRHLADSLRSRGSGACGPTSQSPPLQGHMGEPKGKETPPITEERLTVHRRSPDPPRHRGAARHDAPRCWAALSASRGSGAFAQPHPPAADVGPGISTVELAQPRPLRPGLGKRRQASPCPSRPSTSTSRHFRTTSGRMLDAAPRVDPRRGARRRRDHQLLDADVHPRRPAAGARRRVEEARRAVSAADRWTMASPPRSTLPRQTKDTLHLSTPTAIPYGLVAAGGRRRSSRSARPVGCSRTPRPRPCRCGVSCCSRGGSERW